MVGDLETWELAGEFTDQEVIVFLLVASLRPFLSFVRNDGITGITIITIMIMILLPCICGIVAGLCSFTLFSFLFSLSDENQRSRLHDAIRLHETELIPLKEFNVSL